VADRQHLQRGYECSIFRIHAGVEADLSYTDFKGSDANSGLATAIQRISTPWTYNQDQRVNWLATFRGRLGWTPGDHTFLFYATGGLAVGGVKASNSFTYGGLPTLVWTGDASGTKVGWTLGGGIEARLMDNWTAKLEYLYYDLGHLTVVGTPNPTVAFTTTTDFAFHGNIIRVGLNKKFTSN
jgi:outer membrane immunogenic protein